MSSSATITQLRLSEEGWTASDQQMTREIEEFIYEYPHPVLRYETVPDGPTSGYVILGPSTALHVVSIHKLSNEKYALLVGHEAIYEGSCLSQIRDSLRENILPFLLAVGKCHLKHLHSKNILEIVATWASG